MIKAHEPLGVAQTAFRRFVKEGPNISQFRSCKENIVGGFSLELSTNANLLVNVTNIVFYHLPLNYLDTYHKKYKW
ncbi:hypothetical protein [Coxiella-like endosymbiont]|uniref:hypothetical protein n=1 Tax=Coxiella-like endosymbiont TaxID=1592897 RepID=UPI00272A0567|nr:hypothetical protein [Coxiella-like endosymbiont]